MSVSENSGRESLYAECRRALFQARDMTVEEITRQRNALTGEISGDEGDISQTLEYQERSLKQKDKLEGQLREIDAALERIRNDSYGICEETGEDIEERRLRALPWTRFSAEGAEMRERRMRHFAKAGNDTDSGAIEFESDEEE